MSSSTETRNDFSCGGVVLDEKERALLLIRVENFAGNRIWTFPKGHPDGPETDVQAALREVREETGWDCRVVRPITDVDYFYTRDGVRFHKTVRWFLMHPDKKVGDFAPGEVLDCRWFGIEEARRTVFYDSDKALFRRLGF